MYDYQLDIHRGSHREMTGRMMINKELKIEKTRCVMVSGDTNSILAVALAASVYWKSE